MKSTSVSTKIITILLLLAVIGYFAVQGYNYFVSPETTTLVYRYHMVVWKTPGEPWSFFGSSLWSEGKIGSCPIWMPCSAG